MSIARALSDLILHALLKFYTLEGEALTPRFTMYMEIVAIRFGRNTDTNMRQDSDTQRYLCLIQLCGLPMWCARVLSCVRSSRCSRFRLAQEHLLVMQ